MRLFAALPWVLVTATLAPAQTGATPPDAPATPAPAQTPRATPPTPRATPPTPRTTDAHARSRVVVVDTADDPLVHEAATRLHAELSAAGFEVARISRAHGPDLRAMMARVAQETGAFAAATISRLQAGASADLWIVDRVTRKTVVRTVEVDGAGAPTVLAVRAVELLQASLLEATVPPRGAAANDGAPPRPIPADVMRWMAPERPRAALLEGVGLGVAAVLLQSTGGVGPALGPALRLSVGGAARRTGPCAGGLAGRLTLAGPALSPDLVGARGTVAVRQELAVLEAICAPADGGRLVPLLSVGAGGHHLHAQGAPEAPLASASGEVWSIAALAGAGAGVRVSDRAALMLDVHALFLQPRPVVKLAGEALGSAGRPALAGFLGLVVRL